MSSWSTTSQLETSSSLHPFRFPFTDSLLFDLSLVFLSRRSPFDATA